MHVSCALFTSLKRGRRPLRRGGRTETLPTSSSGTTPLLGRKGVETALSSSCLLEEQCRAEQGQARLTDQQYWCIIILELHICAIWYFFFFFFFAIIAHLGCALGISPSITSHSLCSNVCQYTTFPQGVQRGKAPQQETHSSVHHAKITFWSTWPFPPPRVAKSSLPVSSFSCSQHCLDVVVVQVS